jgi:hypothetical protein
MSHEAEPDPTEWEEEHFDVSEYSVFGWTKWENFEGRRPCHTIWRLSINGADHRGDRDMGDRVLAAFLC